MTQEPCKAGPGVEQPPMDELKAIHALNEAHRAHCIDYVEPPVPRLGLLPRESIEWPIDSTKR